MGYIVMTLGMILGWVSFVLDRFRRNHSGKGLLWSDILIYSGLILLLLGTIILIICER